MWKFLREYLCSVVEYKNLSREEFVEYMLWLHIEGISCEWDSSHDLFTD